MKAKQWLPLAAVITVTERGIGIMLGEIHQAIYPRMPFSCQPETDFSKVRDATRVLVNVN